MFENLSADASSNIKNFSLYYSSLTMIVIYSCMAAVGIIGNIVTCIVIANNKSMHTATNCYLFNLAVSDLIILMLGVPVFNTMSYNNIFTCHLRVLTVLTSIHVTVLTVSIFSVERYVAICHTLLAYKHRVSSLSRALKAILMIWLVGFSCALPITLQFDLVYQPHTNRTVCILNNKVGLYLALLAFVIFFLIPTLIIGTMYALIGIRLGKSAKMIRSNNNLTVRSKQRAPKMLMCVAVAFFVCWLPIHMKRILLAYNDSYRPLDGIMKKIFFSNTAVNVSRVLYYLSASINPIIYNIMSKKFRQASKDTLFGYCRVNDHSSQSSSRESDGKTKKINCVTEEIKL